MLNEVHRSLNKFVQKSKNPGNISNRSLNDHWLSIDSKIKEKIVNGETGDEIDEMRGLYVCINAYHIN